MRQVISIRKKKMITYPVKTFARGEDIRSGLALHYKLIETSGNAIDSSSYDNHGVVSGAIQTTTGADFDGNNDVITPDASKIPTVTNYTFSCIYNGTDTKKYNTILGINTFNPDFSVHDEGKKDQSLSVYDEGGDISSNDNLIISDGNDHRLTWIRRGTGTNQLEFYLDHVAVGTNTHPRATIDPTVALVGSSSDNGEYLHGKIRDLRYYTRDLTVAQEAALPDLSTA